MLIKVVGLISIICLYVEDLWICVLEVCMHQPDCFFFVVRGCGLETRLCLDLVVRIRLQNKIIAKIVTQEINTVSTDYTSKMVKVFLGVWKVAGPKSSTLKISVVSLQTGLLLVLCSSKLTASQNSTELQIPWEQRAMLWIAGLHVGFFPREEGDWEDRNNRCKHVLVHLLEFCRF